MYNLDKRLFVGIKISSKLQRELDNCRSDTEHYFKGEKPGSLQIVSFGEEKLIGRFLQDGFPVSDIDNVNRNVRSILTLVTPTYRIEEGSIRIYAGPIASTSLPVL
jgi:hypothetical protein